MIPGIDPNATIDYVSKSDGENPTVWKLGTIEPYFMGHLATLMTTDRISAIFKTLQLGVKGWSNFVCKYEQKEEQIFDRKTNIVPFDLVNRIPVEIIAELSEKLFEINQFSMQERKN